MTGIYQSEFLFELFLIIEEEYINTTEGQDVNTVLIESVKALINGNDNDLTTEYDTFIESAVKSYISTILNQTGGGRRDKPIYNTAQIRK